jgi:hypothetical protein
MSDQPPSRRALKVVVALVLVTVLCCAIGLIMRARAHDGAHAGMTLPEALEATDGWWRCEGNTPTERLDINGNDDFDSFEIHLGAKDKSRWRQSFSTKADLCAAMTARAGDLAGLTEVIVSLKSGGSARRFFSIELGPDGKVKTVSGIKSD